MREREDRLPKGRSERFNKIVCVYVRERERETDG